MYVCKQVDYIYEVLDSALKKTRTFRDFIAFIYNKAVFIEDSCLLVFIIAHHACFHNKLEPLLTY